MEQEGFGVGSERAFEQTHLGEFRENFVAGAKCTFSQAWDITIAQCFLPMRRFCCHLKRFVEEHLKRVIH